MILPSDPGMMYLEELKEIAGSLLDVIIGILVCLLAIARIPQTR